MAWTLAGLCTTQVNWFPTGVPVANLAVTVRVRAGANPLATDPLATLYTDQTAGTTVANPTFTDSKGNLAFFTMPKRVDLWANNQYVQTEEIEPDPNDPAFGGATVSPATTVTGPPSPGDASVVGVDVLYARGGHGHGAPSATAYAALIILQGTHAARPAAAAANNGFLYYETDTTTLWFSNGSSWAQWLSVSPATTVTGPDAYGTAAAVGTLLAYARADHDHGSLADPRGLPILGTGRTGATASTDFGGATASGPPASGNWQIGEFIVDQTGAIWVCTATGTPGTWGGVGGVRGQAPLVVVTAVATSNITLSGLAQTVDGVAINTAGLLVLAAGQTTNTQNGPWVVQSTAWVRPAWFSAASVQPPIGVLTSSAGTTAGETLWVLSGTASVTVGTSAQTWVKVPFGGGTSSGTSRGSLTGTGAISAFTITHSLGLASPYTCSPRFFYASPVNPADAEVVPQIGSLATNAFVATFPEAPISGQVINWVCSG